MIIRAAGGGSGSTVNMSQCLKVRSVAAISGRNASHPPAAGCAVVFVISCCHVYKGWPSAGLHQRISIAVALAAPKLLAGSQLMKPVCMSAHWHRHC